MGEFDSASHWLTSPSVLQQSQQTQITAYAVNEHGLQYFMDYELLGVCGHQPEGVRDPFAKKKLDYDTFLEQN